MDEGVEVGGFETQSLSQVKVFAWQLADVVEIGGGDRLLWEIFEWFFEFVEGLVDNELVWAFFEVDFGLERFSFGGGRRKH